MVSLLKDRLTTRARTLSHTLNPFICLGHYSHWCVNFLEIYYESWRRWWLWLWLVSSAKAARKCVYEWYVNVVFALARKITPVLACVFYYRYSYLYPSSFKRIQNLACIRSFCCTHLMTTQHLWVLAMVVQRSKPFYFCRLNCRAF
jgi:hypothetical protein